MLSHPVLSFWHEKKKKKKKKNTATRVHKTRENTDVSNVIYLSIHPGSSSRRRIDTNPIFIYWQDLSWFIDKNSFILDFLIVDLINKLIGEITFTLKCIEFIYEAKANTGSTCECRIRGFPDHAFIIVQPRVESSFRQPGTTYIYTLYVDIGAAGTERRLPVV